MKVLDLFSGIGGFSLGLERAGFETVAFCEIEKYPRKILQKHWPDVPIHKDVRNLNGKWYRGTVDVVCGGFPCQDISLAGKQEGITAERSGLWSELVRIISEVRPQYAIMENVTNLLAGQRGAWFGRVLGDLAEIGYDAEWHCIPASAIGAHHQRDRVWIIAYPNNKDDGVKPKHEKKRNDREKENSNVADSDSDRLERFAQPRESKRACSEILTRMSITRRIDEAWRYWTVEPDVGRVANGVPSRVDRLRGLGNAVVPQIPELIGRAIMDYQHEINH